MALYGLNGDAISNPKDKNGSSLSVAYDRDGNIVFSTYTPSLQFVHSIDMSVFNPSIIISPQGMAIYEDYAFQYFTNDDSIRIIDLTDYSIDGAYAVPEFVHGNGLMFGNTVQQSGFPLLYASQFGTSAQNESKKIAIAQVGFTTYDITGYYDIPEEAGYHPQFVADWTNGKAYTIGYPALNTGSGTMIISQYNINDMTTITNQWTVPYMGVVQGSCFWNGNIVVIGDSYDYSNMKVTFIDTVSHVVNDYSFVKQQNHDMEFQGVDVYGNNLIISSWIYDASDNNKLKYWLYSMNLPN